MDGRMTVAMNTHQEVCVLQLAGGVALLPDQVRGGEMEGKGENERRDSPPYQVLRCSKIASVKVGELTKLVKNALSGKAMPVIR